MFQVSKQNKNRGKTRKPAKYPLYDKSCSPVILATEPTATMSPAPTTAVICLGGAPAPANDNGNTTLSISVKSKSDLQTAVPVSSTSSSLSSITIRVNATELTDLYDPLALASLVSSLAPGGAVRVEILGGSGGGVDLAPVNDSFVLAGLGSESERRDGPDRILTARKKNQEPASNKSAPIKLNLGGGSSSAVKINLNDGDDDDDDDMVDEDDLLAEEGAGGVLAPPPAVDAAARAAAADDCGGRKACDDCTCGRAEQEAMERAAGGGAAVADENRPKQVPSSSCGNCSKGDAFRCAGCPYLGKPAFKPGEEHLVLDLADDL